MTPDDTANTYLQIGAVVFSLGLGARAAGRAGLSPIPLYLLAGLVVGSPEGCARATALIARGEMSIVLATLGAGATAELEPLAAGYVLVLAIVGPVLMRFTEPVDAIVRRLTNRAELARAN